MAIELRFDLVDLLREESEQRRAALTPFLARQGIKVEFGRRAIDAIKKRTLSGKDKNGEAFTGYSEVYKDSLVFAVHGKTNRVNLRLTGQMQASMDIKNVDATGVTIHIPEGLQAKKASGHIKGDGPAPIRDFWGLSKSDQKNILDSVIRDFNLEEEASTFAGLLEGLATIDVVAPAPKTPAQPKVIGVEFQNLEGTVTASLDTSGLSALINLLESEGG